MADKKSLSERDIYTMYQPFEKSDDLLAALRKELMP